MKNSVFERIGFRYFLPSATYGGIGSDLLVHQEEAGQDRAGERPLCRARCSASGRGVGTAGEVVSRANVRRRNTPHDARTWRGIPTHARHFGYGTLLSFALTHMPFYESTLAVGLLPSVSHPHDVALHPTDHSRAIHLFVPPLF